MRTYLWILTVVVLVGAGCKDEQAHIPAMDDLILYYPCEATEDGQIIDLVQSDVEAEYKWKELSLVDGPFGNALRNHGAGQRDIVRKGLDLGTNDFTIALWVKPKGYSWHSFSGKGGKGCVVYGYNPELLIYLDVDGKMNLEMLEADGAMMSADGTPPKNAWTHLAFVVDRDNNDGCKIYMNGEEVPLLITNMAHSVNHAYDMDEEFLVGRTVVGDLDEVAVYGKALTAEEVASMCTHIPEVETHVQAAAPRPSKAKFRERRKPYRIIYNINTILALSNSLDVDDYINGIAGYLDDTHVDAVFWHDGAGGNTANYDSEVLELSGARAGSVHLFLKKLIAEGNDPPEVAIRETRKRGADIFYAFHLNDCHDSIRSGKRRPDLLATFKVENPDWTMGRGLPYGGVHQLNFAIPEVRDIKFDTIEEAFRKYDFDGLEIDFLRHPPYFMPGTEPENAHILTQFLRRVREHLNQRGEERGRPITLAVRVTENLEACRLDGFEVPTWVEEDLVDILVLGCNTIDVDIEAFKDLTKDKDIPIYACIYFGWPNWFEGMSAEMVRALATNYHYQGADGVYTYNWYAHNYIHRPDRATKFAEQLDWLREIDDPEAMRGKNKRYVADRGTGTWSYPHGRMHCVLPATMEAGSSTSVTILIGEDLTQQPKPKDIELTIELGDLTDDDALEVILNDQALANLQRTNGFYKAMLETGQLVTGHNRFEVSTAEGAFKLTGIHIDVSY